MVSRIACNPFWTIFSLGDAIPRGLVLPFAFGISTLLLSLNFHLPVFKSSAAFSNQLQFILSKVSMVIPFVMFPGLLLISE